MEVNKKETENIFRKATNHFYYTIGNYKLIDIIYGTVYIVIMVNEGLSIMEMSVIFSISSFLLFIFELPSGVLADLYGRKKMIGIGLIFIAIGYLIYTVSNSFWIFLVASLFVQLGNALQSGNMSSWYYEITDKYSLSSRREKVFINASIIVHAFGILGALFGISMSIVGEKNLLYICIFFCLVSSVLNFFYLEDNYGRKQEDKIFLEVYNSTKQFIKDRKMNKVIIYNLATVFIFTAFIVCWQLFVLEKLMLPESMIGVILLTFMITMLVAQFALKIINKNFSNASTIKVSLRVIFISFLIMTISWNMAVFIVGGIIFEFALSILLTADSIWLQEILPSEYRSSYYAAISAINAVVGSVATILLGFIMDYFNISLVWLIAGIVALLGSIFFSKVCGNL